jgi:hypothetical protein
MLRLVVGRQYSNLLDIGMNKLYKVGLVIGVALVAALAASLLHRIPQDPAYHRFADTQRAFGIPNMANVLSNIFFINAGLWGWDELVRRRVPELWFAYAVLFGGIVLTGFGSAYYHWHPDNDRLVWDRIPMTIVFMSLVAVVVGEWVDYAAGALLLFPLITLGVGSVWWWHWTETQGRGDLRFYGWVQFFPMLCIPLVVLLFGKEKGYAGVRSMLWAVVWYGLAKVLEHFDSEIYKGLGVSGHTLKHIAAAVSTAYLVGMLRERYAVSD